MVFLYLFYKFNFLGGIICFFDLVVFGFGVMLVEVCWVWFEFLVLLVVVWVKLVGFCEFFLGGFLIWSFLLFGWLLIVLFVLCVEDLRCFWFWCSCWFLICIIYDCGVLWWCIIILGIYFFFFCCGLICIGLVG